MVKSKRNQKIKESEESTKTSDNKSNTGRTRRASAIKAQKTIRKSTKGEKVIDENNSDDEFEVPSDDDDGDGDGEEELNEEVVKESEEELTKTSENKSKIERYFKDVLTEWNDFVVSVNDSLRELPKSLNHWQKEHKSKGKVKCPIEGCSQKFTSVLGLKYHYRRCGIDLKFLWKCKLCGYEATKGNRLIVQHLWNNHKDSVPTISPEVAEIIGTANTTFSGGVSFVNRKKRRIETFNIIHQFHERFYAQKSFLNMKPKRISWIPLTKEEYNSYIPNPNPSINFKSTKNKNNCWFRLNLFESVVTKPHINLYIGGPVWAMAWCPLPSSVIETDQFLAIASNMNPELSHTLNDTDIESGLIQIWNVSQLGLHFDPSLKPRMAFSIAHFCGMIWDMEWCPGGTAWEELTPSFKSGTCDTLPRLGLLAIACGDGYVRIHSIPHPQSLEKPYEYSLYYNEPVVVLNPPGVGNSVNNENTICKCVSWIHTNNQHLIAAGYGSGVIAVWDLTTKSSLLVVDQNANQTVLRPLTSWIGHSAVVNRIKWIRSSSEQFLISCSFDRTAKLWNLNDLAAPMTVIKKGLFTAMDTHLQWNGIFLTTDDCYLGFNNNVFFKDFGFHNYSALTLSCHKSCIWDLSVSEWTSATVSADAAGEAVIYPNFRFMSDPKRKNTDRMPLYHTSYVSLEENNSKSNVKSKKRNKSVDNLITVHEKPPIRTYMEFVDKYGIIFNDYDLSEEKAIPKDEINRIRLSTTMNYQKLNDYPLISINRVSWNPNLLSYTWVASAAHSGLCRLSCVPFLANKDRN